MLPVNGGDSPYPSHLFECTSPWAAWPRGCKPDTTISTSGRMASCDFLVVRRIQSIQVSKVSGGHSHRQQPMLTRDKAETVVSKQFAAWLTVTCLRMSLVRY